ncbi:hypothetical protein NPIL_518181 [Nephila pilipes]|uniref:Uncharacterized protein n=1 Tax=Nephila pilipes TaxID=299642 RepID=A0A8X6PCL1_NEPPI|nr:hypothetical protein NPIL_518181 [Nephila pilipes]
MYICASVPSGKNEGGKEEISGEGEKKKDYGSMSNKTAILWDLRSCQERYIERSVQISSKSHRIILKNLFFPLNVSALPCGDDIEFFKVDK